MNDAKPRETTGTLLGRLARRPLIVVVVAVLFLPLALAPWGGFESREKDEEGEGRELAELPSAPDSFASLSAFPKRFEAFFNDHFPLRLPLVQLSAAVRFRIFGISPNPAVLVGQDGWFYEGAGSERVQEETVRLRDHVSDHLGLMLYDDRELERWARVLEERRVVLAERGTHYLFALAPNKRMIYPEHLPEALKLMKRDTRLEQLARYLARHSKVAVVDLTAPLLQAKNERSEQLLFYKTDGHWNYYGAFVAYRALVSAANHAFSDVLGPALELDEFELAVDQRWSHPRFTAQMGLRVEEPFVRLVAHEDNPLANLHFSAKRPFRQMAKERDSGRTLSLGREGVGGVIDVPERSGHGRRHRYVKGPTNAPIDRLVVLGDSFIEKSFFYFAAHAKELYGTREILGFPDKLLESVAPTLVVHEIVQGYLLIEPPKNPDSVSQAYLRIEHERSQQTLLERGQEALESTTRTTVLMPVPPLDAPGTLPVVIAVGGATRGRVWFETRGGRRRGERKLDERAHQYLEVDAESARAGGRLVFETPERALENVSVSIRRFAESPFKNAP